MGLQPILRGQITATILSIEWIAHSSMLIREYIFPITSANMPVVQQVPTIVSQLLLRPKLPIQDNSTSAGGSRQQMEKIWPIIARVSLRLLLAQWICPLPSRVRILE